MTNPRSRNSAPNLILGLALMLWVALAQAAGTVTHLSGMLTAIGADGVARFLGQNSQVFPGDVLITQQGTYARIKFSDGGEITLRPNSQLRLDKYAFDQAKASDDNAIMSLIKGGFRAVTGLIGKRNRDKYSVKAQTATIGIRGTHFGALVCQGDCANIPTPAGIPPADGLHVDVAEGAISVTNSAGSRVFDAGQFGYVPNQNTVPVIVPPEQGIKITQNTLASEKSTATLGKGDSDSCAIK